MRKGSVMVELAVSVVALTLLGAGGFQFGYLFWARQQLQSAIASGARYASRLDYLGRTDRCVQRSYDVARNLVVYGDPKPGPDASPLIPGLRPSHVAVEVHADPQGVPQSITMSVRDFQVDAVFSRYRMHGSPSATVPFQGRYAPHGCPQ